jgi:uncharacterized protein YndB with AHSA1/START domain
MSMNMTRTSVQDRELIATRVFDAPREMVYRTWTEPGHLSNWWGPKGFTITTHMIDVRPGGVWQYMMHGPNGDDYDNKITYIEIVSPERIVYSHGDDKDDEQFRVTVTFTEQDGKTELMMRSVFRSAEELQYVVKEFGAVEGAKSTLERLAELLAEL